MESNSWDWSTHYLLHVSTMHTDSGSTMKDNASVHLHANKNTLNTSISYPISHNEMNALFISVFKHIFFKCSKVARFSNITITIKTTFTYRKKNGCMKISSSLPHFLIVLHIGPWPILWTHYKTRCKLNDLCVLYVLSRKEMLGTIVTYRGIPLPLTTIRW